MRSIDKYYKTNDFIYYDDKEYLKSIAISDYGYNIDSNKRSKNKLNDLIDKTRIINKEYYNNRK